MKTNATIAVLLSLLITVPALAETTPDATLDAFYQAGAGANQAAFFAQLARDAVVLGVDGGVRLQGPSLRDFVSASFASGDAWAYRSSDRDIRLCADGTVAWFDESLQHDRLGRGRASGVLVQDGGSWKIVQYNLTVPQPDPALVSPSGPSDAAQGAVVNEAPQKSQCRQFRHKTNKKSSC